jgi:hypothetical protein
MTPGGSARLSTETDEERSMKEREMEIVVFVLTLAALAVASNVGGVDSRELELVRQPDIERWTK